LDHAAAIAKTAEFHAYQPRIQLLSAQSMLQQQDYDQAKKILQELLPDVNGMTPRKAPDMIHLSALVYRTRLAFLQRQDESKWLQRYENAMALSTNKSPSLENRLLRFQAQLLLRQQHYQEAESLLQHALSGYKATFVRSGIAATLAELGQISMAQDHWQDAQNYFIRSNEVSRYLEDLDKVIQNTEQLVKIEAHLGNHERSNALKEWLAKSQNNSLDRPIKKPLNHTVDLQSN
jgi:uncharacterized protein HemY